ncbi:Npt1/Npt2 family nucleotide transporter [Calditrichota bacterium]
MQHLFQRLFNVHPGEGKRTLLMLVYIFLLIATIVLIKPVRTSLFLSRIGIEFLPYAFILVAVSSGLVIALYSKLSSKYRINRLITYILVGSVIFLLFFWIMLQAKVQSAWFYFFLYVWVAIFAVIVTAQFWLLANYVFNAREAKRLFSLLGVGAISGGIFGGYFADILAKFIGTSNILLFGIAFLLICVGLMQIIWRTSARERYVNQVRKRRGERSFGSADNVFKIIFSSKHLTYAACLTGTMVIVSNLVDYQYSAIVSEKISDPDKLTSFFGFWLSNLSVFSLLVQILFTSRIIQNFGIVSSLFILPSGIFIGTIATLFFGGLPSAIILKLTDGGFKNSIQKSGMELLSLPVPAAIKNRVKAFTDVLVDNTATGVGGLLVILLTQLMGLGTGSIGILIIGLLVIWFFFNFVIGREYISTFRAAIEKRTIKLEDQTVNIQDPAILEGMLQILEGDNEKQILYVLNLIGDIKQDQLIPYIDLLLDHKSDNVVHRALQMAQLYMEVDFHKQIKPLVNHQNHEVRIESICYLSQKSDDPIDTLKSFLDYDDDRIRLAALMCAALQWQKIPEFRREFDFEFYFKSTIDAIQESVDDDDQLVFLKVEFARILGAANIPELYPYLHLLLADTSLPVLRQAISSAGQTRSDEFIPSLIAHLGTKFIRKDTRKAISEFGNDIIQYLSESLNDPLENRRIRMNIPFLLADIGTQEALNVLTESLSQKDSILSNAIIKGFSKLRAWYDGLKFDSKIIENNLHKEIKYYYVLSTILVAQKQFIERIERLDKQNKRWVASQLLFKSINEHLDQNIDRIFRFLGLLYDQDDIYNAYLRIISDNKDLRDNAVEFLDNVLKRKLKKFVLPIAECTNHEDLFHAAKELYGISLPDEEGCYNTILDIDDFWLKACTLYSMSFSENREQISRAKEFVNDKNIIVSEAAKLAFGS